MTIKTAIDFDKSTMKECCVEFDMPGSVSEKIIQQFMNKMNYKERLAWIHKNIDDTLTIIDEEELEHWMKRYE